MFFHECHNTGFFICFFILSWIEEPIPPVFYYKTETGKGSVHSAAKMEMIRAASAKLKGLINTDNRNVAFGVPVSSFEGFNMALQRKHFIEPYRKSERFPVATFSGKLIEDIISTFQSETFVRAKGILKIHGIEQERIIGLKVVTEDENIHVYSQFSIFLKDYDIKIPKVVH